MLVKKRSQHKPVMVKHVSPLASLVGFIVWLVGILVFLAVGFGMVAETLTVPWLPNIITITAGWFVVLLTVLGFLLKIIDLISW